MDSFSALPPAFIFDFDGSLCDVRRILSYLDHSDPHLVEFHTRTHLAVENPLVFSLLQQVKAAGIQDILISARGERWRGLTGDWLKGRGHEPEYFYLRDDDDRRPGHAYKRGLIADLRTRWTIVGAVDDDPKVVRMWEEEGIPSLFVPGYDGVSDPATMVIPDWWHDVIAPRLAS